MCGECFLSFVVRKIIGLIAFVLGNNLNIILVEKQLYFTVLKRVQFNCLNLEFR